MGINPKQLRQYVIRPALDMLDMVSPSAEALMMGTAAKESHLGHFLHQLNGGPALGIFQMEPATYHDIWDNFIRFRPTIQKNLAARWPMEPKPEEMITDLLLSAAMCRLHYRRVPEPLPAADDLPALASYWKRFYNTRKGSGTTTGFIQEWQRLIKE